LSGIIALAQYIEIVYFEIKAIMSNFKSKAEFISFVRNKTKQFAIDVIKFCNSLNYSQSSKVISYQLIKSATSTGANYRAVCRSRSKAEFFSKLSITLEEADESQYWLEILESIEVSINSYELKRLHGEISQIVSILTTARKNMSRKQP
jgi:four helix bundle protein